jgi:hypothetical protein
MRLRIDGRIEAVERSHELGFATESLRKERPDAAIHDAGAEDFAGGRAALAAEESARDASRAGELLAILHREREEVRVCGGLGRAGHRGEQHRPPAPQDHRAARLRRHASGLKRERRPSRRDRATHELMFRAHRCDPLPAIAT